jgi:hypothetical protein
MKFWTILKMIIAGAIVSLGVMLIANQLTGQDRAAAIAYQLGLDNGVIVAVVFGGLFAGWLTWGGQRRIAGYLGLFLAILILWLFWQVTNPYFWVVDVILASIFGSEATIFSGVVVFGLFIALFRWISYITSSEIQGLLQKINPPKDALPIHPGNVDPVS